MIKRILALLALLWLTGCSYKYVPSIIYYENVVVESLGVSGDYCIYDSSSPFRGRAEYYEFLPTHYQIILPTKRKMVGRLFSSDDRCFLYTRNRGIAIFQGSSYLTRDYGDGLYQISDELVEYQLSSFIKFDGSLNRYDRRINRMERKINGRKQHYMYIDNNIRIVMFNLSEKDYHDFVEIPIEGLKIKRKGGERMMLDEQMLKWYLE